MKFITDLVNRIFTHWQSTLFGLSYAVIFYLLIDNRIDYKAAIELLVAILSFKNIFLNKDSDKVETKQSVQDKQFKEPDK